MDKNMTNELLRRWVVVVDDQGREHLEARWSVPVAASVAYAA